MKNKRIWFYICGVVALFVLVAVVYLRKPKEGFEVGVGQQLVLATSGEKAIPSEPSSQNSQPNGLGFRECAIFYTPNIDVCNDPNYGWYTLPLQQLKNDRDRLIANANRTRDEEKKLKILRNVIEERESGSLPNGVCKVNFPEWVEHTTTANGEPYPYKNKANLANVDREFPEDWAYCFKPAASKQEAVATAKAFADEYVVKSSPHAGDYFQDGTYYSKIAFTTLTLDDTISTNNATPDKSQRAQSINSFICSTPPTPVTGIPAHFISFEMTDGVIRKFYVLAYNAAAQTLAAIPDRVAALRNMFTTQLAGTNLYLVPKNLQGSIYQLTFDVCGRVNGRLPTSTEFNMSLSRDMNMKPVLIYTAPSQESVTFGTYSDLKSRISKINEEINAIASQIQQIHASIKAPLYVPGYVRYTYTITAPNQPSMGNAIALSTIFDGANGQLPMSELEKREILTSPPSETTFEYNRSRTKYGYVFEGYINIGTRPAGQYEFKINSDDGGDFYIKNTVVATHYNYHAMDNTGPSGKIRLETNTFHPFRARFAQWEGTGSGVKLQWRKSKQDQWQDLPSEILFYDENDTKRYEISELQKGKKTKESDRALVEQTFQAIETKMNQHAEISFQEMERSNRRLTQYAENVSTDGRLYIDIGPFENIPATSDTSSLYTTIQEQPINLCMGTKTYPSPVSDFTAPLQYTMTFWIYVGERSSEWRNIMFHGVDDVTKDRTPAIWLSPNNNRLYIRQRSTADENDGCMSDSLPSERWVHVAVAVNGTSENIHGQPSLTIQTYYDGRKMEPKANATNYKQLPADAVWHWGQKANKVMRLGFNTTCPDAVKGVHLQKVYWFNRVLGPQEIYDMYQTSGILRNKRAECRDVSTQWKDAQAWSTLSLSGNQVKCNPDEVLTRISLEGNETSSRYNFRCCKVHSEDELNTEVETKVTPADSFGDGKSSYLTRHAINCDKNGLNQFQLSANPSTDYMRYEYGCSTTTSPVVNVASKCSTQATTWVQGDSTIKSLASVPMGMNCSDMEHISRLSLEKKGTDYRYVYDCCEIGGLL